jgi:hypothetical protein
MLLPRGLVGRTMRRAALPVVPSSVERALPLSFVGSRGVTVTSLHSATMRPPASRSTRHLVPSRMAKTL